MVGYPLYYTLNNNLPRKDLSQKAKDDLTNAIASLDDAKTEAVFLLICEHHYKKKGTIDKTKLPYFTIQKKQGVSVEMDKLPVELKWILYKFVGFIVKTDK